MSATEDEDGPFVDVVPSGFFREELTAAAVDEFGSDGAWLLLSILSYGWRTYFDLANALAQGPTPETDGSRPEPVDEEFQIVKDLQVQSFLYSAAEQFAGLVRAVRAHETGTSRFFDTYVEHKNVGALISGLADLGMEELENLLGVPRSVDEYPGPVEEPDSGIPDLDPGRTEVADVGDLLVPQSAIHREAIAGLFEQTRELAELILTNIQQLGDLVEVPDASEGGAGTTATSRGRQCVPSRSSRCCSIELSLSHAAFASLDRAIRCPAIRSTCTCLRERTPSTMQPCSVRPTALRSTWRPCGRCASVAASSFADSSVGRCLETGTCSLLRSISDSGEEPDDS